MHVGLANRKRVNVVRIKVTKAVIDEAVRGFVGTNHIENILYRRVLGKAPVIFGDGRRCHLLPVPTNFFLAQTICGTHNLHHVPLGEMPLLELLNCMGIRQHGLFFEVTDETVASLRGDDIRQDLCDRRRVNVRSLRRAATYVQKML